MSQERDLTKELDNYTNKITKALNTISKRAGRRKQKHPNLWECNDILNTLREWTVNTPKMPPATTRRLFNINRRSDLLTLLEMKKEWMNEFNREHSSVYADKLSSTKEFVFFTMTNQLPSGADTNTSPSFTKCIEFMVKEMEWIEKKEVGSDIVIEITEKGLNYINNQNQVFLDDINREEK